MLYAAEGVPPSCKPKACSFPHGFLARWAAGSRGKGALGVSLLRLEAQRIVRYTR